MLNEMKLYAKFIAMHFKTVFQYKFAFLIETIANIVTICSSYVFLMVLFTKIDSICGWSYYEVIFLVSINWICTAFAGFIFWKPMITQGEMIRDGSFDTMLTRPIHPLKFMIYRQFQHTFLGRFLLAFFFLRLSISHLNIKLGFLSGLFIIFIVICGTLIHAGVWILLGSTSFFMINNSCFIELFNSYDGIRSIVDYPLSIFPRVIQVLYTFLLPYGFINYYPSVALLQKQDMFEKVPLVWMIPIVSVGFFLISILIWNLGVKRYHSAGA